MSILNLSTETVNKILIGVLGAGCVAGGIGVARTNKRLRDIGVTVRDIREKTNVEIAQSLVDKAVREAVEKKSATAVSRAVEDVKYDIQRTTRDAIEARTKETIEQMESECRGRVADTLRQKAENVDISALRKDVRDDARKAVAERFNGELSDILEEFNGNLQSVSRIYSSIAGTIAGQDQKSKNITFKVGD